MRKWMIAAAVVATLAAAADAQAFGRRGGCSGGNCYVAPVRTCPGGVCPTPAADPAAEPAAEAAAATNAPQAEAAPAAAVRYQTPARFVRGGLFGWRR